MTFTYLLTNDAVSSNVLTRLTISSFTGFATDVSYQPGVGVQPTIVDRLTNDVIGFGYIGAPVGSRVIAPGTFSLLMVVQTDAVSFQPTLAAVIDGDITLVPSFAPLPIPEPGSIALAGVGMIGFALACRKRG